MLGTCRATNVLDPDLKGSKTGYGSCHASGTTKECLQRLGIRATRKLFSETLSGRKRYYRRPDSMSARKALERKGRNTPIQGTSADITKKALSCHT